MAFPQAHGENKPLKFGAAFFLNTIYACKNKAGCKPFTASCKIFSVYIALQ